MAVRSETEMVAYALEMPPALLPYATELLADLDALGSDAAAIVDALRDAGVSPSSSVIDLGAGKGAVAIACATAIGCQVIGIELFAPFVDVATAAAAEAGVAHLCRFVQGYIGMLASAVDSADAVVFSALGDVLGPFDETMRIIRQYVRPGGVMVFSDGHLRDAEAVELPEPMGYLSSLEGTRHLLTAHGDTIVAERFEDGDEDDSDEADLIEARALTLLARHPELRDDLQTFVRDQRDAYEFLNDRVVGAVWTIRRNG